MSNQKMPSYFSNFWQQVGKRAAPLLMLVGASLSACNGDKTAKAGARAAVPVDVASVVQKPMPVQLEAIGTVQPVSTVEIVPQVTGLVMNVHFKEGDFVKRGDLLFSIDTRPYSSSLAVAQAQLAKNEALAAQAKEDAERAELLAREGLATEQDLARARANAAALAATLKADKAQIRSATLNVQFAKIRSPIDGRTGRLLVNAGNVVKANDNSPLVVIRSLVPIYVQFSVPQENLPSIRAQLSEGVVPISATPRGRGAKTARGHLTFVDNAVDPATGTITLKGIFKNENLELWPGEFVDVVAELAIEQDAIVAPEAAVQEGQEGAFAFVVDQNDTARLRSIEVKRSVGEEVVISRGLKQGEHVVTNGQVRLREGTKVKVRATKKSSEESPPSKPSASGSRIPSLSSARVKALAAESNEAQSKAESKTGTARVPAPKAKPEKIR